MTHSGALLALSQRGDLLRLREVFDNDVMHENIQLSSFFFFFFFR